MCEGVSMSENNKKMNSLPLLPLRDLIIFPHMMMPLFVGREKSISALEEAMSKQTDIIDIHTCVRETKSSF